MNSSNEIVPFCFGRSVVFTACAIAAVLTAPVADASGFSEARFIEVVNEVKTVSLPDRNIQPAAVDKILRAPNLVQTGRRSRAQLQTTDGTIARVGSNTIFSFDDVERSVDLEQGSLLFHSPSGKGGGKIVTASATASVLGTTIIVAATNDGGFKVLVLEGTAQVDFPDGTSQRLGAGQMTFILPSATPGAPSEPGPVLNFDLDAQQQGSGLVNDFNRPLQSMPQIDSAVQVQREEIVRGELQPTGLVIVGANNDVSIRTVDASLLSVAVGNGERTALEQLRALLDATVTLTSSELPNTNVVSTPLVVSPADLGFTAFKPPATVPFVGIAAGTVVIQTPSVDFSSLDGAEEIFLFGNDSVRVEQNTVFTGFDTTRQFTILGQNLDFGNHTMIANFPYGSPASHFSIISRDDLSIGMATVSNSTGGLDITAEGKLQLVGTNLTAGDMYSSFDRMMLEAFEIDFEDVNATSSGRIHVRSTGDAVLRDVNLSAVNSGGGLFTATDGGDGGGQMDNGESGDGIDLTAANIIDIDVASLTASHVRLRAQNINLIDVEFNGAGGMTDVNMSAKTIVLDTVSFPDGSTVNMRTQYGQLAPNPNTSASPLPGFVNFVRDVTYAGDPAQNYVPTSVGGSADPGSERIFIHTMGGAAVTE